MTERSDDDHHDELERCPCGDKGERWPCDVENWHDDAESASEINIFFIHLTISSDSRLG